MAPFGHPKSTKIYAKIDSKRHPKNDRFSDRFFAQVGSILGPKLGPKSRSRRSQNAPQDTPKTPPRQPKSHKSTQDRNLVHFWSQSPMGYPPLASIFEVFSTFKFKFRCLICARQLGKFYITEGSQEACGNLKKLRIPLVDLHFMAWTSYGNLDSFLLDCERISPRLCSEVFPQLYSHLRHFTANAP